MKSRRKHEALRFLAIIGIGLAGLQFLVVTYDLSKRTDLYSEVAALAPVASASLVADRSPAQDVTADQSFVIKAAEAGMTEVAVGNLAAEQASSIKVKNFGKMMVTDHGKTNTELKALAQKKGVKLPVECNSCEQKTHELRGLTGNDFDKKFMEMMVADHKEAVSLFSTESTQGTDSEIKRWAGQKLPGLEHHLSMAEKIKM